jgi:hypothetical protein
VQQPNAEQPRKTMTYRQLLLWLERDAKQREDAELDMPVILRVDLGGELHVCGLYDVAVDAGCSDDDALVLDAADGEGDAEHDNARAAVPQ